MRCRRPTRRSAPRSTPKPRRAAGRRCIPSWARRPHHRGAAWPAAMRSASSVRWSVPPHRPADLLFPPRAAKRDTPPLLALEPPAAPGCTSASPQRFAPMLDAGLVDEVRRLRARADLHPACLRCAAWATARPGKALDADDLAALPERGIAARASSPSASSTWLAAQHAAPRDARLRRSRRDSPRGGARAATPTRC